MKTREAAMTEIPEALEGIETIGLEGDNKREIVAITSIKTLDAVLKAAQVDLAIWEVEKHVVNKWEVAAKVGGKNKKKIHVVPLWQVKVWLKRKITKRDQDAIELLLHRGRNHLPKYRGLPKYKKVRNPHLLEVAVFDPHFGKFAWAEETGTDQDLKKIESVYHDAVVELAEMAQGFPVEKVVLPIGQDFFHIDNPANTTVNGTPLDVDSRYPKIFETGLMATVKAIDYLMQVAPVEVVWVPGNHDRTTSYHLVKVLQAWYRGSKAVDVNVSPSPRKYYHYGTTLIGYTHGNDENHQRLPSLMADEQPKLWAETTHREWHLGHYHRKTKMAFGKLEDSLGSVLVRVLPSIAGTDSWHHRKGFVKARRAAEAYLYSKDGGYVAHFSANVRD